MSFINKLFNWNKDPILKIDVFAPCDGEIIEQKKIPDEGFSESHIGVGLGIDPSGNNVVAPISGKLVVLFRTKHAYIIKEQKSGISVFLHLGINTVNIAEEEKAFSTNLQQDDEVIGNTPLCQMDLEKISKLASSKISALLVQNENMENKKIVYHVTSGKVKAGDLLFSIVKK